MINVTNININRILSDTNKAKEPTAVLAKYRTNKALTYVLKLAFDNTIKSVIPAGTPPHSPVQLIQDEPAESLVIQHLKSFSYWVESGNSASVDPARREQMFIQMLETISPAEVKMIVAAKDKELHKLYKNINPAMINNVFPGLLVDPMVIATPKKAPAKKKVKKVSKKKVTVKTNEDSKI